GLKPKGVGEPPQQLIAAIFVYDGLADDRAQTGHPIAQPLGHAAAVEREIRAAAALRHQIRFSIAGTIASQEQKRNPPLLLAGSPGDPPGRSAPAQPMRTPA